MRARDHKARLMMDRVAKMAFRPSSGIEAEVEIRREPVWKSVCGKDKEDGEEKKG